MSNNEISSKFKHGSLNGDGDYMMMLVTWNRIIYAFVLFQGKVKQHGKRTERFVQDICSCIWIVITNRTFLHHVSKLFSDSEAQVYSVCETRDLEESIADVKKKIEKNQT